MDREYTRLIKPSRKRIYGEEFRETTSEFRVEPCAKNIRIDRFVYENCPTASTIVADNGVTGFITTTTTSTTNITTDTIAATTITTTTINNNIGGSGAASGAAVTTSTINPLSSSLSSSSSSSYPSVTTTIRSSSSKLSSTYLTVTERTFSSYRISLADVPKLCKRCFSIVCICDL